MKGAMSPEYYCFKSIAPGFALFFAGIALKLEKRNGGRFFFFLTFNLCPLLLSVATDDRKQVQCLNILLSNKTAPISLGLNGWKDTIRLFLKDTKIV